MKTIKIEDFLDFKYVSRPGFSPDGRSAAFVVQQADPENNNYSGDLYLLDTDPDALNTNAQLTVLQELEACYLVEFDGKLGYVRKDMVSTTRSSGGSGNTGGEWSPPVL